MAFFLGSCLNHSLRFDCISEARRNEVRLMPFWVTAPQICIEIGLTFKTAKGVLAYRPLPLNFALTFIHQIYSAILCKSTQKWPVSFQEIYSQVRLGRTAARMFAKTRG